jgi:hypothetical protein
MFVGQFFNAVVSRNAVVRPERVVMRRLTAGILVPMCLLAAGCGAASLPTPTSSLPSGTRVGPQVFLSDSASSVTAVRTFVEALGANGASITAGQAKLAAPLLESSSQQAQIGLHRLMAEEVDDVRLEQQRKAITGPLGAVVVQMSAIAGSAGTGDAAAVVRDLGALRIAIAALKRAGA